MMLSPTFFHDLVAQTPTRVIALAGSTAVIVQFAKVFWPKLLSGKFAIALNVLVSVAGVFIGMNPAHFWSETTLAQVLMVAAAAAGVHGTAKSLSTMWAAIGAPAMIPLSQAASIPMGFAAIVGSAGSVAANSSMNTGPSDPQLATDGAKPVAPS